MEWLERIYFHLQWAVSGFFGALVAVPFQSDLKGKRALSAFMLSGWATAHVLAVPVCVYLKIDQGSVGGIGFLLGAFGGAIIAAVLKAIEAADLWALIRSRLGGGGQ